MGLQQLLPGEVDHLLPWHAVQTIEEPAVQSFRTNRGLNRQPALSWQPAGLLHHLGERVRQTDRERILVVHK